jgi:hypothetical protein
MKIYHLATLNRSWAVGKMFFFQFKAAKHTSIQMGVFVVCAFLMAFLGFEARKKDSGEIFFAIKSLFKHT